MIVIMIWKLCFDIHRDLCQSEEHECMETHCKAGAT